MKRRLAFLLALSLTFASFPVAGAGATETTAATETEVVTEVEQEENSGEGASVEGEDIDYGQSDYLTISESGQSFVRVSCSDDTVNDWKDLTSSGIKEYLNVDFEPNNCCIKALYQ